MQSVVRFLRWFCFGLLVAASALLVWALYRDPGTLLLRWLDMELETTAAFLLVTIAVLLLSVWGLDFVLRRLPQMWSKRRRAKLRGALHAGLLALAEGRWASAKKQLLLASTLQEQKTTAMFAAVYAAEALDETALAQELLSGLRESNWRAPVEVRTAVLLARQGDASGLERLRKQIDGPASPAALRALVRCLKDHGRLTEAQALMGKLQAARAVSTSELKRQESQLLAAALMQCEDLATLEQFWRDASKDVTRNPEVVAAYVQRSSELGNQDNASDALHRALKQAPSEPLFTIYGRFEHKDAGAALERAERWQQDYADSAALQLAIGRMARRSGQLDKARGHLLRAVALGGGASAFEELGQLAEQQGDIRLAKTAYHNALRAQRGEAAESLHAEAPSGALATEVRSSYGVPQLPQA